MIQVLEIDEYGFYTNKTYMVKDVLKNHVTEPLLIGYVKPLWTGSEWIEGATETEIKDWQDNQTVKEPVLSKQDKKINDLEEELLISNVYITDMELRLLELEMKLEALSS